MQARPSWPFALCTIVTMVEGLQHKTKLSHALPRKSRAADVLLQIPLLPPCGGHPGAISSMLQILITVCHAQST